MGGYGWCFSVPVSMSKAGMEILSSIVPVIVPIITNSCTINNMQKKVKWKASNGI